MNLASIKVIRVKYKEGEPDPVSYLNFLKQSKEFYFHLGCVLDNLARLIYIIREPESPSRLADPSTPKLLPAKPGRRARRKARKMKQKELRRRYMAFGATGLKAEMKIEKKQIADKIATKPDKYSPYDFVNNRKISQVAFVRHFLTHVWSPPRRINKRSGIVFWPEEIWTEREYVWPHSQLESKTHAKLTYVEAATMMESDYKVIEGIQNQVFEKLTSHVPQFENDLGYTVPPIQGGILPP